MALYENGFDIYETTPENVRRGTVASFARLDLKAVDMEIGKRRNPKAAPMGDGDFGRASLAGNSCLSQQAGPRSLPAASMRIARHYVVSDPAALSDTVQVRFEYAHADIRIFSAYEVVLRHPGKRGSQAGRIDGAFQG
jgi:hypothetical protein